MLAPAAPLLLLRDLRPRRRSNNQDLIRRHCLRRWTEPQRSVQLFLNRHLHRVRPCEEKTHNRASGMASASNLMIFTPGHQARPFRLTLLCPWWTPLFIQRSTWQMTLLFRCTTRCKTLQLCGFERYCYKQTLPADNCREVTLGRVVSANVE